MAENDLNGADPRSRAQQAIFAMLTDAVRRDPYPSITMLNIIESHMTEEQLPDYLDMLMEKIDGDRFPSLDMIRRVIELT
jgi:hypothetical protein